MISGSRGLSLGGSFPETPFPTHHGGDMKRCRITVLKRHFDEELAKEYGSKGIGKCPMLKEGQIFYADYAKPDGFCDEAWKAIYQYVFALAHGSGQFYYGDWIEKPGVAICSCNDGLRPVIFKVERTDEEATFLTCCYICQMFYFFSLCKDTYNPINIFFCQFIIICNFDTFLCRINK